MASKELVRWLGDNRSNIEGAMIKRAKEMYGKRPPSGLFLSDLRICHAVSYMPDPPGYYSTTGSVIEHGILSPVYHEAHLASNGDLIEYVPGQFFADEERGKSGIPDVASLAPHLLLKLTNQIYVLAGDKSEIQSALGILYFF